MSKMKAIILAGGKGTRMKSELPKVLHKVYDKCIIDYVCDACMEAGIKDQYVIVGHKSELVIDHLKDRNVTCCLQKEQLGTGHAVMQAEQYINDDDLILIVNALKVSGAEAISINDERIINMSDMVDINESFIKINGQRIVAPYIIKAIGNQSYLESSLISNGGPVDEMKKIGQDVSITKSNKVIVPKYNKEIKIKYMN